jgi:hypothetical protein
MTLTRPWRDMTNRPHHPTRLQTRRGWRDVSLSPCRTIKAVRFVASFG